MAWSIAGKSVVITGATSGLGEAVAIELAGRGAQVNIVGRSAERGAATLERIRRAGDENARLFIADLSRQADVRSLAVALVQAIPSVDVLINNAGAIFMSRGVTGDGIERTFALNHLAYFLLTILLLDKLSASAQARIINVASDSHRLGKIDFADLQSERSYRGAAAYETTKLCNVLFTRELSKRLAGTGVTANAVHPGVVATRFGSDEKERLPPLMRLLRSFAASPEHAARAVAELAADPAIESVNGGYFVNGKKTMVTARLRDLGASLLVGAGTMSVAGALARIAQGAGGSMSMQLLTASAEIALGFHLLKPLLLGRARSDTDARKLWEASERLTGCAPSRRP